LVFFRAATQRPIDLDDPGWAEAYVDGGARFKAVLRPRVEANQSLDLDVGVVLRPYVVGDGAAGSEAVVFDCELDGSVWRNADGTLAEGSAPGVVRYGLASTSTRVATGWVADQVSDHQEACL